MQTRSLPLPRSQSATQTLPVPLARVDRFGPAALVLVCFALACTNVRSPEAPRIDARTEEAAKPWTSLDANDSSRDFAFVVVTDRTGGHRDGVFERAMPKVNLLEPAFVVSVGDLIEGYSEDQARLDAEWDEIESFVAQLEIPFFYAVGNHDMSNAVMAETWRARFGPSFYHFNYKDVVFLVLNSELFGMVGSPNTPVPGPWTQPQQMEYIERVLEQNQQARWTIVLLHQPLWDTTGPINSDWLRVEGWLAERKHTVFAGHFHRYSSERRNDQNYITLGTTGGGSPLRGKAFGEFDHVALVSMTSEGPKIANLLLEGIEDVDVATPASRGAAERIARGLQARAVFVEPAGFEVATVEFVIENPGDTPLSATATVADSANVELVRAPAPVEVPPGESRTVQAQVRATSPRIGELRPAIATWRVSTRIGERAAELPVRVPVLPVARHPVPANSKIALDGALEDWTSLPFAVSSQGDVASPAIDPEDLSFRFGVARDDANLYLAVDVTDDSIVEVPSAPANEQDGLTITIDARPEEQRNQNRPLAESFFAGDLQRMSYNLISVGRNTPSQLQRQLGEALTVAEHRVSRTETGYRVELAVPVAFLDLRQGAPWSEVRITVLAHDRDAGEEGTQTLHWQPNRFGEAPVAGTGVFVKTARPRR